MILISKAPGALIRENKAHVFRRLLRKRHSDAFLSIIVSNSSFQTETKAFPKASTAAKLAATAA